MIAPIDVARAPIQPITRGIDNPPENGMAQIAAIVPAAATTIPTRAVVIFQTYFPSPYLNQSCTLSKTFPTLSPTHFKPSTKSLTKEK